MAVEIAPADERIARIAGRAHGVASRRQLMAAGLSRDEIQERLDRGALRRVHRGVYRVGHSAPSTHASYLAAVLACGAYAALGGRAAAFNYGLVKGTAPPPEVVSPRRREVPGVLTRRRRPDVLATWHHIPTLTVPATLVDLAGSLTEAELARACHEAGVRYRTTPRQVASVLRRRPNARGAATLRRVLGGDAQVSLSRLESRFVELLRENRLPLPVTNRPAGSYRVDCRWPEHHLTVELDGFRFHNSRYSWEQDHRREREAYARGDDFRRYTWGDVVEAPAAMLNELSCLLPLLAGKDRTAAR